jgi:prepilin-type N-terminal cleavage/methylation domain-containing protein
MSLQNIKKMKADKGFTIVELLIVIVIIGILAAITIVAYNGIQNRGKTASAQSAANAIMKKAEAANSIASSYPTSAAGFSANTESIIAGQGTSLLAAAPTSSNGTNSVTYEACTAPSTVQGARINYYDFVAATASGKYVYAGNASTGCTAWSALFAVAG